MEEKNLIPPLLVEFCPGNAIAGSNDLSVEILRRLPVKSLVRFKLVWKKWFSFISCPNFYKIYMSRFIKKNSSPISPSGIYFYYSRNDGTRSVDSVSPFNRSFPPVPSMEEFGLRLGSSFKILNSCNGLFLGSYPTERSGLNVESIFVFNPVTKIAKVLPPWWSVDEPSEMGLFVSFHLAYEPSISQHYKVICVKGKPALSFCEVFIYRPEEDSSWRKSSCEFPIVRNMQQLRSGLYFNGGIHWIGGSYSLHFNVDSEEVERKKMTQKQETRYYGEWGGHLHLIQIKKLSSELFTVLEMEKDTYEWFPIFRVYLRRIISKFPEVVMEPENPRNRWYNFNILAVVRGVEEADSEIVVAIPGKVIAYNFYQSTVRKLLDMPPEKAHEELLIDYSCSYPYFETLSYCGTGTEGASQTH